MGGGASRKKSKSPREDNAEADIDPASFCPEDTTVAHVDLLWKLNTGADPKSKEDWNRRKMWLTSKGGFFYYSRQFKKPLGRSVAAIDIVPVSGAKMGRYLFEVHPIAMSSVPNPATMSPTVMACDSEEKRDDWVRLFKELKEKCHCDGLEENFLIDHAKRRRMSTDLAEGCETAVMSMFAPSTEPIDGGKRSSTDGGESASGEGRLLGSCFSTESAPDGDAMGSRFSKASIGPNLFVHEGSMHGGGGRVSNFSSTDSPTSTSNVTVRRDSQDQFSTPSNSFLVLDWDDTLFPTTWIRGDLELDWKRSLNQQLNPSPERSAIEKRLKLLAKRAEEFLRHAKTMSHIFIVTLARRPWVDISTKNFMPMFEPLLKELDIVVIYARDAISESMERDYNALEFRSSEQEIDFWMRAKGEAMRLEFERLHEARGISWKNILSFGDSEIERRALQLVGKEHVGALKKEGAQVAAEGLNPEVVTKDGHFQKLRSKTLKMIDDPSIEELTAQLTIMTSWVGYLILDNMGVDIELEDSGDDERLMELNRNITGKNEELSWPKLAGMKTH